MILQYLYLLKKALLSDDPDMVVVLAARYMMIECDRDLLPDWVEALANANLDNWAAAADEVRNLMKAEELEQ